MSCYHPLVGIPTGKLTENGKTDYKIIKSANLSRTGDFIEDLMRDYPDHIIVPCGRCIGCRLDYSRSWADRMMLELETSKSAVFATLTYDNDHIPCVEDDTGYKYAFTLCKKDCQDWMKRLRRHFKKKTVRFYLAGEYGSSTARPHYHAILFGLSLDDFPDKKVHGRSELGDLYYVDKGFTDIWSNGFCLLSDVSWKTCAYVARYVTKKIGAWYDFDFEFTGVEREFALMSRKPGLGRQYLKEHPDALDFTSINLSTPEGGRKIRIPKYYLRQLQLTDPERYDKLMSERKELATDAMLLKLQTSGLEYLEYLSGEEVAKMEQIKGLHRHTVK